MARFLRFMLAIAALPFCAAQAGTLWNAIFFSAELRITENIPSGAIAFGAGFLAFFVLILICPTPVRTYVLGHELTHALWGLAFGARVSNIKVAASGGSVLLSKSNVWITLAPYFFPFYTMLVAFIALITRIFIDPLPFTSVWIFALGFTWCFHVYFTIDALFQRQPDILEYGRLFSWVFIWVANLTGILTVLCMATPLSFKRATSMLCEASVAAYAFTWKTGSALVGAIGDLFAK